MVKLEEFFSEDEEELESEKEEEEEVLLGFVDEPVCSEALERHFFPSKVGGVPAWLDPVSLPRGEATVCGFCGKPLAFLMQVYGPLETEPAAFHRTLFLFVCKSNTCLKRHFRQQEAPDRKHSVRVFCCQLPRSNPFYSFHPAKPGTLPPAGATAPLCDWCGAWVATKRCGGCRDHAYCSKEHQVEHWKRGHSEACKRLDKPAASADARPDPRQTAFETTNRTKIPETADTANRGEKVGGLSSPASRPGEGGSESGGVHESPEELSPKSPEGQESVSNHPEYQSELGAAVSGGVNRNSSLQGSGSKPGISPEGVTEEGECGANGVAEKTGALSIADDDVRFPVSPVDWESGAKPRTDSARSRSPAESSQSEMGSLDERMGGSSGTSQDDVSSGRGPRNEAGSSDWDSRKSSLKSPTIGSASTSEASSSMMKGESTGTKFEKTGGKRRGTELTAVVKPRALDPKLWPELEIAVESEDEVSGGLENGLGDVSALLEQYGRRVEKKRDFSEEDLEEAEAGMRDLAGDKKQWAAFEARLASAPEQVIRYCRSVDTKPLWPTTSHQPSKGSIPPCPGCGSERIFEFQVLPQLLYYMQVDSSDPETLDWGTIAVYTCSKSCSGGTDAYREECVWVQVPQ